MTSSATLRYVSTTLTTLVAQPTQIAGEGDDDDVPDPLTSPATSRIFKVTIASAIVVLGITGLITGFKASRPSPPV